MKCFVTFRLKPDVTTEEYLEWFQRENVPAVRKMTTIKIYRVWQVIGKMEGDPPQFLEEMEIDNREDFEAEIEALPEMAAMLAGWYQRVTDQVVFYAEEVSTPAE
jgi:hypothetical protein